MDRICPSCKENLSTIGDYFCYKCGAKLPPELTASDVRVGKTSLTPPKFIFKEEFIKIPAIAKKILLLPLLILLVVLGYFFFQKLISRKVEITSNVQVQGASDQVIKTEVDLPETTFGAANLVNLVPSNVDLFIEGKGLTRLLSAFTKIKSDSQIPSTNLKVSDIDNLMESSYVIFSKTYEATSGAKARAWGLASKSKNEEKVKELMGSTKEATWSIRLIKDYVVVSNDKGLFKEVGDSLDRVSLNLGLNSRYASAKNSLPKSGKLFILILTKTASNELKELKNNEIFNPDFQKLIDILLTKDKNSYVVD